MNPGDQTRPSAIARPHATAQQRFWCACLVVVAGSMLIALAARVQVPMWPVPMTMQSLAVLGIAMLFGARIGIAAVIAYLAQGTLGLPVFAGGGGAAYLFGPTGGFLLAFAAAAGIAGWLSERGTARTVPGAFLTAIAGMAIVYLGGVGWLAAGMGLRPALEVGALPFLPGDAIKAAIAAVLVPAVLARRMRRA